MPTVILRRPKPDPTDLSVSPLLQRIYTARGVRSADQLDRRLQMLPLPSSLTGLTEAVTLLENVLRQLEEEHHITLSFAPEVRQRLGEVVCADLSMGGRGIGNALEEVFVNPLSRGLFEAGIRPGEGATVQRLDREALGWTLELVRHPEGTGGQGPSKDRFDLSE